MDSGSRASFFSAIGGGWRSFMRRRAFCRAVVLGRSILMTRKTFLK
jgi:hypothetical protein